MLIMRLIIQNVLKQRMEELKIRGRIETISIIKLARILKSVLKT